MEGNKKMSDDNSDSVVDKEIRLEEARLKRIKAERSAAEKSAKVQRRTDQSEFWNKVSAKVKRLPLKARLLIIAVLAASLLAGVGVVLPIMTDTDQTQYLVSSDLEDAVAIDELSTVDYVYHGVAEKHSTFLWQDRIDYRVKYEAHVRANYNLTEVRFSIDNEKKIATAYIPGPKIAEPQIVDGKYGYLPEGASADLREVIALCKEDAANDVDKNEINEQAEKSLKDTIEALTMPLLGDKYTLDFKPIADFVDEQESGDKADEKAFDDKKEKNNQAEADNNEE